MQGAPVGIQHLEGHAVGVGWKDCERAQYDVGFPEWHRGGAADEDGSGFCHLSRAGLHLVGHDLVRAIPLKSEEHRKQCAVTATGCRKGAVQVDRQAGNAIQEAEIPELVAERGGGPHRADRV